MPGFKQELLGLIRSTGMSAPLDVLRFRWMQLKNLGKNRSFVSGHPGVPLPPPYMVYESFQIDYAKYFVGGLEDAQWIVSMVKPYLSTRPMAILDWGCGPARIIRHLPGILGSDHRYFGTDYNPKTIAWCDAHLHGVSFSVNSINPPLPFAENTFDLLYGISIFTHLSLENHTAWSNELFRVMAPSGILMVTTHGDAFLEKLTTTEADLYHKNVLVTRYKTKEGHRTYAAFHPPSLMRNMFASTGFEILEHRPGQRVHVDYISQDVWILKKS